MQREDRETRVYVAALKVFGRYGFGKATLEDIAGELGVTKPALYSYAKSKRDLYEKSVSFGLRRWQARARDSVIGIEDAREAFLVICRASFDYLAEDSAFRAVLVHDPGIFPVSANDDPFREINRESIDLLRALLQAGIDQGCFRKFNASLTAEFIFSIYVMYVHKLYVSPEVETPEAMFQEGLEHILRGLEGSPR